MGKESHKMVFRLAALCVSVIFFGAAPVWGFTEGKSYDKSNVQEIEDLLMPAVANWVKKDGWVIKTAKPDLEIKFDKEYIELTEKNRNKYEMDERGYLVLKGGGDKGNVRGLPFPSIDPNDPHAAQMILENFKFRIYRIESESRDDCVWWVSPTKLERENGDHGIYFYWQGRKEPIPNPNNYIYQQMLWVTSPFDLRGMVQMTWAYDSDKEDIVFAYVPMLRRVRRVSAATRSDPYLGSDLVTDDAEAWLGKNTSVEWKYIEKKTLLMAFTTLKPFQSKTNSDGTIQLFRGSPTYAFQDSNLTGVAWAPTSYIWTTRPVWIVEGKPKDPYYNFGSFFLYLDAEIYCGFGKECYDRSGSYWRTLLNAYSINLDEQGRLYSFQGPTLAVDDKANHACMTPGGTKGADIARFPHDHKYGVSFFNETQMKQLSK